MHSVRIRALDFLPYAACALALFTLQVKGGKFFQNTLTFGRSPVIIVRQCA